MRYLLVYNSKITSYNHPMENQKLLKLMKDYDLKAIDVSKILNVSLQTVRIWRSKSERNITDNDLKLLRYELER